MCLLSNHERRRNFSKTLNQRLKKDWKYHKLFFYKYKT